MPSVRSHRRARLAALLSVVLAFTGLQMFLTPAPAQAASTTVVINEVYGGGGNGGATYTHDFVELWNLSGSPVTLTGKSLQYRAAATTGASGNVYSFAAGATIPANDYYLVRCASQAAVGAPLPVTPDATDCAINLSGSNGQIYLVNGTTGIAAQTNAAAPWTFAASVIDFVGYGTASIFEGAAAAPALTNTTSVSRNATTHADNDANSTDFAASASMTPTPSTPAGPGPLTLATIGNQTTTQGTSVTLNPSASGGTSPYSWSATGLPTGLSINPSSGQITGTANTPGNFTPQVTVTDNASPTQGSDSENFTWDVNAVGAPISIATIQGTGPRSSYAPAANNTTSGAADVTTEGVVTAIYEEGFASAGTATCGFCGFTIQTGGSGGAVDATPGAADGIFVWGGSTFNGQNSLAADIAIGDSVQVTGKISEFGGAVPADSLTELNITGASSVVPVTPALAPVTKQTVLPATYAEREAHESELFAPTDVVITDTFNFETFGELGLATGNAPLDQPTQVCDAQDSACISAEQTEMKNRGYFIEDGTNTSYLTSGTYYRPYQSNNSDIPLPFMDATHSARIGAHVTYPLGGVLEFRNSKWYVMPPKPVLSTHNGTPDLGTDVVTIEQTRSLDNAPANVGGELKLATYNVENYFSITGAAFAAANPYYTCTSDYDRTQPNGNPVAVNECTSPQAIPSAWDPVTGAPTAYTSGLVSAPRGAWRQEDLDRQTDKIVTAINGLGADVVSLQELGNPNKIRMGVTNGPLNPDTTKADSGFGTPIAWRDESIAYLVNALNADAGAGTWAFVASPEESTDATAVPGMCAKVQPNGQPVPGPASTAGTCSWASGQDVIRSGFIYKRATIVPVGPSDLDLPGSSAPSGATGPAASPFDNAREPLAQFFKPVGHPNSDGFAVIANHFKSKGNSDPAATGDNVNTALTGAFNGDRVRQAKELLRFANEFAAKWDTDKVFLVGDFNSYTGEDPIQTILTDPLNATLGFEQLESDDPTDTTYIFSHVFDGVSYGAKGSLDHVFASEAAVDDMVTGVDVWEINANESTAFNFGRYNTNKTLFLNADDPFAGSDHNPELIGIDVAGTASRRDIQIIGSNDFHGRLVASTSDGGAAQLAGAVKSLKDVYSHGETPGNPNSIFVAAGDLIGASTFESFIDKDKPTLKALNAAGLEVSSLGNHEFDQGVSDLLDRVMQPQSGSNPDGIPGGLQWQYIASNVVWNDGPGGHTDGDPIVVPTATKDFGGGIKIGFVGAVTEDLPNLVAPSALTGVAVNPIAAAVNTQANLLVASGADVVVLLVHEGAPSTNCATMNTGDSAFAELLGDLAPNIDAVISGHTHLEYACSFPVPEWAGDPITERPVLSAGQYGVALDQLVYSFDTTTGQPVDVTFNNVGVKGPGSTLFSYPEDPTVKAIVDQAVADAAGPGNLVLGKIAGPFKRARLADGTTENRGGESTLGNLVAEIQRAETPAGGPIAPAQIAFMNPGGLRDDLLGTGASFPKDVTYRSAAGVQPFANTLVNMDMTGAQIRTVLEQQWQRDPGGNVPSRPFLRLGTSKGFTYTYYETPDPAHSGAFLGHVTGMYLNGTALIDAGVYSVTMNSFLASGGDNFRAFLDGADKRDTGVTDLQAQVDYFAANAQPTPLAVDYGQHAVRVEFPTATGAPAPGGYSPGQTVAFDVTSLSMTGVDDTRDTNIKAVLDGNELGTFPVTTTVGTTPFDDAGTASVSVTLPAVLNDGVAKLHLVGTATGTDVIVPIPVDDGLPNTVVAAASQTATRGQDKSVPVTVTPTGADGAVEIRTSGGALLGSGTVTAGSGSVTIAAANLPAAGTHTLTVNFLGEAGAFSSSTSTFSLTVNKATPVITAPNVVVPVGQTGSQTVTVTGTGVSPTGSVTLKNGAATIETKPLTSGQATFTLPALPDGTTLTVEYSGDGDVAAGSTTFTVSKGAKAAASLASSGATVTYGASATVSVNVSTAASGVNPTGTVTINNGPTALGTGTVSGGVATVTLAARSLPVGTHTLAAVYSGDSNLNGAATTVPVTVTKAKSTTAVKVKPKNPTAGKKVKLKITLTGENGVVPTGKVTVKVNGKKITVTLKNGKAKANVGTLPKGTYKAKVKYAGDASVTGSKTKVTITVT